MMGRGRRHRRHCAAARHARGPLPRRAAAAGPRSRCCPRRSAGLDRGARLRRPGVFAAVTTDTLFRIASITKSFTATAVLQLRDEGRLRLDDPLVAHVPEARAITDPFGPIEDLTIRRLLTHSSGLQRDTPADDLWIIPYFTEDELLARLDRVAVMAPPETGWRYSNLAYNLLGIAVGRIVGEPFATYLQREVIDAAGLASTTAFPEQRSPGVAPRATVRGATRTTTRRASPSTRRRSSPTAGFGRRSRTSAGGSSSRAGAATTTSAASTAASLTVRRCARCSTRACSATTTGRTRRVSVGGRTGSARRYGTAIPAR